MIAPAAPTLITNMNGTAEPSTSVSVTPQHTQAAINRVDYACMTRNVAEEGEWTTDARIYNDPNSPGPYVLTSRCGDVWEVPRADGSVLRLYAWAKTRTFLHVPPGSYVDCRVKYLSVAGRDAITEMLRAAGDGNADAFHVTGEGEVVSAPGEFYAPEWITRA